MTDSSDTYGQILSEDSGLDRVDTFLLGLVVGIFFMLVLMMLFGGPPSDPSGGAVPL